MFTKRVVLFFAFAIETLAIPTLRNTSYPFTNLVAFGDELSDNGNGSYAHGITGNPAFVYGYGTWTNGPVAVSYLADLLKVPLVDYAFGGCCGGGSFGASLDNIYTPSPAGSPSLVDQIKNYTTTGVTKNRISTSIQFVWIGENDVSKHTDAFWFGDPHNTDFANNYTSRTVAAVQTLLTAGAPYVFVSNIYPKHLAPVTKAYLCGQSNQGCVDTWGQVIQQANNNLKAGLKSLGNRVIYYDSFSFVSNLMANATANGFTAPTSAFCDGAGDAAWKACWVDGQGLVAKGYFWLNFVQPTTVVHRLIALDMKKTIDQHFGMI